jgi:hypothetical protein
LLSGFTSSLHSIAARRINAAKLPGDGDSVFRLFYDTVKEAITALEANVHRLAEVSTNIIDQCVAQVCHLHVSMEGYLTTVLREL